MTETATLVRHFHASREEVFRAWTDTELLVQWYCPNPSLALEFTGTVAEGEAYELAMGGQYTVRGAYLTVDPPNVLEFTWQWPADPEPSIVRVELTTTDDGTTRLRLTHRGLADAADAEGHAEGWDLQLNRLVVLLGLPG